MAGVEFPRNRRQRSGRSRAVRKDEYKITRHERQRESAEGKEGRGGDRAMVRGKTNKGNVLVTGGEVWGCTQEHFFCF